MTSAHPSAGPAARAARSDSLPAPDSAAFPTAGVVHVRHRHDSHFTVVGNHLAQHPRLSAVAIGVGVYIQSLPDGARVGIKELTGRFREGEMTLARALRELEAAGYLERRRERVSGGRVVTRTTFFERPGAAGPVAEQRGAAPRAVAGAAAVRRVRPAPAPQRVDLVKPAVRPTAVVPVVPAPSGPSARDAARLLAGLRLLEPRLVLSERDVRELVPAVCRWLERGVGGDQVARTLTGTLPAGAIRRPARLLAHRLAEWLPPVVPELREQRAARPDPFQTCDGCERAFRAPAPGLCRDCRAPDRAGPRSPLFDLPHPSTAQ
ncbi:helix-turn-helix domain-containing protein [Streptomyces sp. LX-29]|uniref:helix-turn-helix domain-containing protein n=1 Tax=Streptomyces sp. LX-29 TaxID=2900152 RepID=UPI00240DDEB0|nr:helix-turn-helix domain-containing protein [Streptomyces sp. LX-29]WFB09356.1 helix-turn-helix domain-containing protein [Streptomyces sp. LX-29]